MRTGNEARSTASNFGAYGIALAVIMITAALAHAAGPDALTRDIVHGPSHGNWARRLVAQLNQQKRLPPGTLGEGGTAKVAFRIDRSGNLLSATLVQSTGQAALDQEALAIVKRAQPFPAPPADIAEDHLEFTFTVPIVFNKWPAGETLNTDMATGEERALNAKLRSICRGC
jgi:periplasmic protein TonB